jgi:hypothetical protein
MRAFPACRNITDSEQGAFGSTARYLSRLGMVVMPLGGADGKKPMVTWRTWRAPLSQTRIESLIEKFPRANISVICGPSGVTIVDIDDPEIIDRMIGRFGPTPLITASPRGGVHLWYRSSRERCYDLQSTEGLKVQIKGIGGQVAVPPSVRFGDDGFAGLPYEFRSGSWETLRRPLPTIRPGAMPQSPAIPRLAQPSSSVIKDGDGRNTKLLRDALRLTRGCPDLETLRFHAAAVNARFDPPLTDWEFEKVVQSAWRYESTGNNWVGQEQTVWLSISQLNALASYPNGGDAALFTLKLKAAHWDGSSFAAVPVAMAAANFIPGWGKGTYRSAIKTALEAKVLRQVRRGGRGPHDPALYCFQTLR